MIAAETPCTTRAAISTSPVQASPHARDDTRNSAVGRAAAQQQQAAEAEQVSAQDPLRGIGGEPQVLLDRREAEDHDLRVEDHHEEGKAQQRQRLPATRVGLGVHALG
jgi:hypothetical protein